MSIPDTRSQLLKRALETLDSVFVLSELMAEEEPRSTLLRTACVQEQSGRRSETNRVFKLSELSRCDSMPFDDRRDQGVSASASRACGF